MSAQAPVRAPGHQGTPEWLDNRLDVVGSSDIPVITGSSPFRSTSLFDLWAVKTREVVRQEPTRDDESEDRRQDEERFWFGHALEEPIAKRYALVTGRRVRRVNDQLRHPVHSWVGASLDREVVGEKRLLEVKWSPRGGWAAGSADPVPAHVLDQVQWQMLVRGWPEADVAVLDGDRLRIVTVLGDPAYQDDLMFIAHEKLWRFVLAGEMPKADGSEATKRALSSIANRRRLVNGFHIDARQDEVLNVMVADLREAQQAEKAAAGTVGSIKNALGALLLGQEATGADGDGWRLDWHQNRSSEKVNHEGIERALWLIVEDSLRAGDVGTRGALRDIGLDPDVDDPLEPLVTLHTVVKEGARPMRLWVKDEESGRWQ